MRRRGRICEKAPGERRGRTILRNGRRIDDKDLSTGNIWYIMQPIKRISILPRGAGTSDTGLILCFFLLPEG